MPDLARVRRRVAIVGVGRSRYARDSGRSRGALVLEACRAAIADSGIDRTEVDGLAGNPFQASPHWVQAGLGIPTMHWWGTSQIPISMVLADAVHAVHAGTCDVALVYQCAYRTGFLSRAASDDDPVRAAPDPVRITSNPFHVREHYAPFGAGRSAQYAGFMRRYQHEHAINRVPFGRVAVNSRSHAVDNPQAIARTPLTLDDYLGAPLLRDPMCLYDIDFSVDGANALVVTTAERAADLDGTPVYVDAIAYGSAARPDEDLYASLDATGQEAAAEALWARTDLRPDTVDLLYLYDGYTIITLKWMEALGLCGAGEAGALLEDGWDDATDRFRWRGTVPLNPNGGSLSEGAVQGAGHLHDAVVQLRGAAGDRQHGTPTSALLAIGGLFHNATTLTLSTDPPD